MYKHILVTVDGSKSSDQALTKAVDLAKHYNSALLISHVIDVRSFPTMAGPHHGDLWSQYNKTAEDLLEKSKKEAETAGLKQVQTILRNGNPRFEVPDKMTKEYDIDLLIVGESGRNAAERMIIGSVTEACMRRSPCDVLTVKNETNATLYRSILVAVDGSEQAEHALATAVEMANIHQAKLTIAHVSEWGTFSKDIAFYQHSYVAEAQKESENMLKKYKQQAESQGLKDVQTILRSGNPRLEVPRVLTVENNCDLLITAETGQHAVSRFFTGSVAESAVRRSPCDVITVRKT
ncbi:universal stress protein [Salicibibacter cibarius]|uniref:Universal stress protein n=1 Tax=Salicibibacter cibarius TaxID=2743000 RepID=A0A7T6Z0H4_9BACI|nr:universal stress protein [Salicibibacter cibarius]QQK74680.1 universal stress protein [Salicibibacter cibarius]